LSAALTNTTTTLTSSQNPSTYEQPVTFTATVDAAGSPLPASADGDTVTFRQGSNVLGTGSLNHGSARFTISTLTTGGTDNITAVYAGDSTYASSTSAAVKQVVNPVTTSTSVSTSQNPSNVGQSVTFTATVTPSESAGTPTGNVAFDDGSTVLATVALSGGVASYTTTTLAVGTDPITAVYKGSTSFATSTSGAVNQSVGVGTFTYPTMIWNGITRYYEVFVPSALSADPPMLLMLHGTRTTPSTGSDPTPVITLDWGWQSYANQYAFILVQPASTFDPATNQWNWNSYCMDGTALCAPYGVDGGAFPYAEGCGSTDGECPDDIGFLRALIQNLTTQYNVNRNQVYVTGFSSGAQMTERVGNELSDIVAAIAPVSGPLYNAQGNVSPPLPLPTPPNPFPPISVQLWEGTEDQNLWPCGYGQTNYSGVIFTVDSADDTFNYWTQQNQGTGPATTQPLCSNGVPNNANDAPSPELPELSGDTEYIPGDTGNFVTGCVPPPRGSTASITGATEVGARVTIDSKLNPGAGCLVIITGMIPSRYNGYWVVTESTPTAFQYTATAVGLESATRLGRAIANQIVQVQFVWEPGVAHSWNEYNIPYIWSFLSGHPK